MENLGNPPTALSFSASQRGSRKQKYWQNTKNSKHSEKHHVFHSVKKITWPAAKKHERPEEFTRSRSYSRQNARNVLRNWENVENYSLSQLRAFPKFSEDFSVAHSAPIRCCRPLPKPKNNLDDHYSTYSTDQWLLILFISFHTSRNFPVMFFASVLSCYFFAAHVFLSRTSSRTLEDQLWLLKRAYKHNTLFWSDKCGCHQSKILSQVFQVHRGPGSVKNIFPFNYPGYSRKSPALTV